MAVNSMQPNTSTRPNEYSTDFNSLAGDASEHSSQFLTCVKHSHGFVMFVEVDAKTLDCSMIQHLTNGIQPSVIY